MVILLKHHFVLEETNMNFFTNPDWFGRPGPFAYNLEYIIFIALSLIMAVVIPILLRKKSTKTIKMILIVLWAVAVFLDILKYGYSWISNIVNGTFTVNNLDFPLWTCSMFLYLMPIVFFCKNEKVSRACAAFICTISFFAGMVNFAIPCEESLFSFYGLHKTLFHYILMLTPAIMLGTGYFKLKLKDIFGIMIVFAIFGVPVYIFNAIFKMDYMFTYPADRPHGCEVCGGFPWESQCGRDHRPGEQCPLLSYISSPRKCRITMLVSVNERRIYRHQK